MYRENRQQVLIANSDGVLAEDERLYLTAFVQVVASDGDVVQTGYDAVGGLTGMELLRCLLSRALQRPRRGGP